MSGGATIHLIGVCGTAMATLAAMLKRKGLDVTGVHGGVDFTRSKRQKETDPRVYGFCGAAVLQPSAGRRRSWCSKAHRDAAQIEKRRKRAA